LVVLSETIHEVHGDGNLSILEDIELDQPHDTYLTGRVNHNIRKYAIISLTYLSSTLIVARYLLFWFPTKMISITRSFLFILLSHIGTLTNLK
jgi:hypothetical protein